MPTIRRPPRRRPCAGGVPLFVPQFALPPQPPVPVSARPALSASATPLATPVARRRAVVRRPARMLVFASEYKLQPSRRVVPAGRVIIQTKNIGEDDHNLAVRAANGHVLKVTPVIRSGASRPCGFRCDRGGTGSSAPSPATRPTEWFAPSSSSDPCPRWSSASGKGPECHERPRLTSKPSGCSGGRGSARLPERRSASAVWGVAERSSSSSRRKAVRSAVGRPASTAARSIR